MAEQTDRRLILVTAFEPSGDLHAAPVIAALKARCPDWEIAAWGGAHMEAAGATLMQNTASDGVMGLAGITRANEIRKIHQEILRWGEHRKVIVHLAVDSPSANLPLSAKLKLRGTRVLNLVAPQLWAWGEWRANRVRRISDGLLCLLPFEERWFRERQFVAKYVGHPVLSQPLDLDVVKQDRGGLPPGGPRILLLPGSRTNEIRANAKLIVRAFELIQSRHRSAVATVVATTESNARLFRDQYSGGPEKVAAAALEILGDGRKRAQASDDLRRVANSFGDRDPGLLASLAVEHLARTGSITNAALDSIVASKGLPGDQSELTVTHS